MLLQTAHAPMFYTNFEIMNVSWFRDAARRGVRAGVDATGQIFGNRWGDAPLRWLTLALFARTDLALLRRRVRLPAPRAPGPLRPVLQYQCRGLPGRRRRRAGPAAAAAPFVVMVVFCVASCKTIGRGGRAPGA